MKVLLLERNLLWSERLKRALLAGGHEVVPKDQPEAAELAILHLGEVEEEALRRLTSAGIKVIGHAGHKEEELLERGRSAGCWRVVSNGTIASRVAELVEEAGREG